MKKGLLFFVFAYTVSICLLSAQLAKHSTDRWYAQHWMPVPRLSEILDSHVEKIYTDENGIQHSMRGEVDARPPAWVRPDSNAEIWLNPSDIPPNFACRLNFQNGSHYIATCYEIKAVSTQ